jgi:hypothetical protein
MVSNSINKLHNFFFIGIFEKYTESIEQFNKIMGADVVMHPLERINFRAKKASKFSHLVKELQLKEYNDRYDDIIYKEAVKIFNNKQDYINKINK